MSQWGATWKKQLASVFQEYCVWTNRSSGKKLLQTTVSYSVYHLWATCTSDYTTFAGHWLSASKVGSNQRISLRKPSHWAGKGAKSQVYDCDGTVPTHHHVRKETMVNSQLMLKYVHVEITKAQTVSPHTSKNHNADARHRYCESQTSTALRLIMVDLQGDSHSQQGESQSISIEYPLVN